MRYKRVQVAVKHSFRALEVSVLARGSFTRIFMCCLWCQRRILSRTRRSTSTQAQWAMMWRKALGADGRRIIDIRVTENAGEVASI